MYADYIVEHPEYKHIYVRSELSQMLVKAARSLDRRFKLVVRAGHRPVEVQRRLFREAMQDYINDNPEASGDDALNHARMYISDPDIKLPPHCCGAAVDVDLYDESRNELVDFGCQMNTNTDVSHLHSDKVSEEQKQNRTLLLNTMLEAGFASYYAEWWHFSYGDEIWAWFYRKDSCLYGLTEV